MIHNIQCSPESHEDQDSEVAQQTQVSKYPPCPRCPPIALNPSIDFQVLVFDGITLPLQTLTPIRVINAMKKHAREEELTDLLIENKTQQALEQLSREQFYQVQL